MSEYQYYEFQAIDRPLGDGDRKALRALSTRARITATSFTNAYQWGDFSGDPAKLMEQWFDLHLYLANWGTRRLTIRLPKRLVDRQRLDMFLREVDWVEIRTAGENLIIDILQEPDDGDDWDYESGWYGGIDPDGEQERGSGWLTAMAPLRADLLAGDLRLFYLLWLMAVEADTFEPDETEPMPGIGPLTEAIEAFADFFGLDRDLVAAAAERPADAAAGVSPSPDPARRTIAAMADGEKTEMLSRLLEGDPYVASELRVLVRNRLSSPGDGPPPAARTIGELRSRAEAVRLAREQAEAERAAAERQQRAEQAEKIRQMRLRALAQRGEGVWREIETEIERRNAQGYDKAAGLLFDLRAIAGQRGTVKEFTRRLQAIRERHANKMRFIERLAGME